MLLNGDHIPLMYMSKTGGITWHRRNIIPPLVEIPFWLTLTLWALLPSTHTPWINLSYITINAKDAFLVGLSLFYLLISWRVQGALLVSHKWTHYLPTVSFCVIIYAIISTTWNQLDDWDMLAMRYTLLVSASALILGFILVAQNTLPNVTIFLKRLTFALTAISAIYLVESFFSVGMRETKNIYDFGIERVRGPLFGSSTGYFILLPAFAFALEQLWGSCLKRMFWFVISLVLCTAIVALGSRAGLISLSLFFLFSIVAMKPLMKKIKLIILAVIVLFVSFAIVFLKGDPSRLITFEDISRFETYRTSIALIQSKSPVGVVIGSGYGAIWPWYLPDTEGARINNQNIISTLYGQSLYHPHSLPLLLSVELGILGLCFYIFLMIVFLRNYIKASTNRRHEFLVPSMLALCFALFAELIIFKNWSVSTVWWIYVFGFLRIVNSDDVRTR